MKPKHIEYSYDKSIYNNNKKQKQNETNQKNKNIKPFSSQLFKSDKTCNEFISH
jgi:hypothetical protein